MAPVAAAVFDLDGTLVDSLDDITVHLNHSLAAHGQPTHSRADVVRWVGHGAASLVSAAISDPAVAAAVVAEYRERYRARPVIDAQLYPGIAEVLDAIAPRCKLAVLSNKPHEATTAMASALLARWPFAVIAGQRPGRPQKPEAASALAVLDELGCAPHDCVMIGDSEVDVATARNAGMRSIAVTWGFRGVDALRGAELIVHTPAELAAQLQ